MDEFEAQLIERLKKEYPEAAQVIFMRYRTEEKHRPQAAYMHLPYMGTVEFPLMNKAYGIDNICGYLKIDIQIFLNNMAKKLLNVEQELGK